MPMIDQQIVERLEKALSDLADDSDPMFALLSDARDAIVHLLKRPRVQWKERRKAQKHLNADPHLSAR